MTIVDRQTVGMGALVERDDALAALHEALSEARAGSGRIALVSGEAGVGKTSLVRSFCRALGDVRIFEGACDPLFTPRPLGPFEEIAERVGPELSLLVSDGSLHEISEHILRDLDASPTVLVLEDVHWADEATLDVLRMLGRRIAQAPGLVVATYRDDELERTHGLRVMLGTLATSTAVTRIRLEPLTPSGVAQLAAGSGVDAARLYRVTAGNPFFVTQVIEAGTEEVPPTLRDATLARAARLDGDATAVLEAVSIIPPHAEPWLLEGLFGDVSGRIDDCIGVGLLTGVADGVAFRHELARIVVEQELHPPRRRSLHRAVLEILERAPAERPDLARLAHHAEAAGSAEAVLRLAPAAAVEATARGAHREAAAQYARALRFSDGVDDIERADLLERRSDALYATDDQVESTAVVKEAIECYRRAGDARREATANSRLVSRLICTASFDEAVTTAERSLELLQAQPPSREQADALAELAALYLNMDNGPTAGEIATRAVALAREHGDDRILIHALTTAGTARMRDDAGVRDGLDEALELAVRCDIGVVRILNNIASTAACHHLHAETEEYAARTLAYCADRQLDMWRLNVEAILLSSRVRQGRWDEALSLAAQLEADPKESSAPRMTAMLAFAIVRARRGDPGVHDALDQVTDAPWMPRLFTWVGEIAVVRAEVAWLERRLADTERVTDEALALAGPNASPWLLGELCYWRWKCGMATPPSAEIAEPYALQIAGEPLRAAAEWERLGCPYEVALALSESDDEDTLRRAHAAASELGARPLATVVARTLRERGVRDVPRGPRPSTKANEAELTSREVEVLALVAEGLRNADIAERLVVSRKTVDHHVSAILRKLDVDARGKAVAEARRRRLLQDG